jgi:hypothetical protein
MYMRYTCGLCIPEPGQDLIRRGDCAGPDYFPDQLIFLIIDEHPVTPEFPAYGWTGFINTTDKSLAIPVPAQERTRFSPIMGSWGTLCIPVHNLISVFSVRMDRKKITTQIVPAVIVTVVQLALDPDERSIPGTTFPAAIADKSGHP